MIMTCVAEDGRIVLPSAVSRQLEIGPGTVVDVEIAGGRVMVTPQSPQLNGTPRIISDPVTGFPVLTLGPGSPVLTSEQVEEMLADFP